MRSSGLAFVRALLTYASLSAYCRHGIPYTRRHQIGRRDREQGREEYRFINIRNTLFSNFLAGFLRFLAGRDFTAGFVGVGCR